MSEPTVAQENFEGGAHLGVAGYLIPENGAARIDNGLLNEEGMIYKRGGATYHTDADFGADGLTFLWEGYYEPGGRRTLVANDTDFGVIDEDDDTVVNLGGVGLPGPAQSALINHYLFIGGGYIYGGSRKTGLIGGGTFTNGDDEITMSSGASSTTVEIGTLVVAQYDTEIYRVVEVVDATTARLDRDYAGTTGAKVAGYVPIYTITTEDVYPISPMYAVCAGRLLAVREQNDLIFSGVNDPHSWAENDYHETPEGAHITGLGVMGQEAILFTTSGTWTLSGLAFNIVSLNGDPQHRLAVLSRDLILWSGPGIVSWEQALVVPAVDGVWIIDGTSAPARISRPIQAQYQRYVRLGYRPGISVVWRGHLFMPILSGGMSAKGTYVCRLDREALPWVSLQGQGANVVGYIHRTNEGIEARESELLAAERGATSRVLNCSTFFYPGASVKNDPDGTTPSFVLETRTYGTGGATKNVARFLRTRYDLAADSGDDPTVEVSWASDQSVTTYAKWNQVQWDEFQWGGGEAAFTELDCSLVEGQEMTPRCRIGKRRRFVRFRYHNADPVANLFLKEVTLFTRPSKALRV